MSLAITSSFEREVESGKTTLLLKIAIDKSVVEEIEAGSFAGIGSRVAQEIATKIYPEIEKRLLDVPEMRERIIQEAVAILGASLAKRVQDSIAAEKATKSA